MQLPTLLKHFLTGLLFDLSHEVLCDNFDPKTWTDWTIVRPLFATAEHDQFWKVSTRSKLLSVHLDLHNMLKDLQLIKGGQHLLSLHKPCMLCLATR